MPKTKATRSKSTPTKARVTFSDTTPSAPTTNTSSNTETPSDSLIDATEDICFTETSIKIFNKKNYWPFSPKRMQFSKKWEIVSYETTLTDSRDKPLHLLVLAGPQCEARVCLSRRKNSDTKSDKGCGVGGYTLNLSWEFRNAFTSTEYLAAIYTSGYTGKSQRVQSLHGNR